MFAMCLFPNPVADRRTLRSLYFYYIHPGAVCLLSVGAWPDVRDSEHPLAFPFLSFQGMAPRLHPDLWESKRTEDPSVPWGLKMGAIDLSPDWEVAEQRGNK